VRFGKDESPYEASISGFVPIDVPRDDGPGAGPTSLYVELETLWLLDATL